MRRSGKTTRVIDAAIQTFFKHGQIVVPSSTRILNDRERLVRGVDNDVIIIDHDWHASPNVQRDLMERILIRLRNEHRSLLPRLKVRGDEIKIQCCGNWDSDGSCKCKGYGND